MDKVFEIIERIIKFSFDERVKLKRLRSNPTYYFIYLFSILNNDGLNLVINVLSRYPKYINFFLENLNNILPVVNDDTILRIINLLNKNNITNQQILERIQNNCDTEYGFYLFLRDTIHKSPELCEVLQNNNKTLYAFKEKLSQNKYTEMSYLWDIIYHLANQNIGEYIDYIFKELNINIEDFYYLDKGTHSWCFTNGELVFKIASATAQWDILMFYRINEFIVRKKIGKGIISISPLGDVNSVTNKDIDDAINDMRDNHIILTDGNYARNFAVVDYEISDNLFRDVDGIREEILSPYSDNYKQKKVKLIDHEYIFKDNDSNKKCGLVKKRYKKE